MRRFYDGGGHWIERFSTSAASLLGAEVPLLPEALHLMLIAARQTANDAAKQPLPIIDGMAEFDTVPGDTSAMSTQKGCDAHGGESAFSRLARYPDC